ncbi:hypothetical protein I7I50_00702 [Histoplasma capsulatum G186AR]|uniref:Uncharacterized protein n=1 Tax=Ajellomyces capsulatus TaxID=5037 RepID=A0A8H7YJX8_AJECA|nr:hypothetical protein I7I52_07970 [Histoplasma capsulatum]QSS72761.1 hypothetical protein I7I50_00702 [Histoplasma capsulatum G186AR]
MPGNLLNLFLVPPCFPLFSPRFPRGPPQRFSPFCTECSVGEAGCHTSLRRAGQLKFAFCLEVEDSWGRFLI